MTTYRVEIDGETLLGGYPTVDDAMAECHAIDETESEFVYAFAEIVDESTDETVRRFTFG